MTPDVEQKFLAAMLVRELELSPGKSIDADGQWHRCKRADRGPKDNSGSYKLCIDGPAPYGFIQNFTDGQGIEPWHGKLSRNLTDAERADLARRIEEQRRASEEETAEFATEARARAQDIWKHADDAPADHPYLLRKKVKSHRLRIAEDNLLAPMYDPDGALVNLQMIAADGAKWYLKGGRAAGCSFQIGGDLTHVVIAEGFATSASIAEATGAFVIVAFSAGNLKALAIRARQELNNLDAAIWKAHEKTDADGGLVRDRRENLVSDNVELIIAVDDDWKTEGNPGLMNGIEAACAARFKIAIPTFDKETRENKHTDFNDVACLRGNEAVKENLAAAVEPNVAFEQWLKDDPRSRVYSKAAVRHLAWLQQHDLSFYENLLAALKKKIRIRVLEGQIKNVKAELRSEPEKPGEELYPHWSNEPWPEAVETGELLVAITEVITRYVATLGNRTIVPALWIMFSYVHDVATHSPLLLVTSPEPDSGKTTLLGVIGFLARRALPSVTSAVPRCSGRWRSGSPRSSSMRPTPRS